MPWSLGWTTNAQTGQAAVPTWSLMSFHRGAPHPVCFGGGGGGVRTLEDTGLRCVTSGTLVWVETTALKSQYILPTEK